MRLSIPPISIPPTLRPSRAGLRSALVSLAALAVSASAATAFERKAFDADAFGAAQRAGGPVVVHVTAPWCPTCKAQHKVIDGLAGQPEFKAVTVFDVDFDSQKDALKLFKAGQQSTLIGFSMGMETKRLVGDAGAMPIKELFSATLARMPDSPKAAR